MDTKAAAVLGISIIVSALITSYAPFAPGRYQMTANVGHAYVLDTATGQVWEQYAPANSGFNDSEFRQPK